VIAGGYDPISEYTCAGFNSLRLVADGPPRPFSRHRQGMNLGEGYAVMVLERADDAQRRGATALAIVAGFGESSDAHHLTQPEPTGEGASRAIDAALRDAGINAAQIDVIAAHATATPQNDAAEVAAYQRIFGNHLPNVPVVAFKSHFGHTLGGAGSVELVMSLMAMGEQIIPPTATVRAEDNEFPGLNLVVDQPRRAAIERTLNVSMGFGGANACVILQRPTGDEKTSRHQDIKASRESQREVLITGVGVVLPGAVGNDAFVELLRTAPRGNIAAALNEYEYAHLFNARRARRMSDYVKLTLAATSLAMQDAGVDEAEEFARECGAILGTTHGAAAYSEMYYRQVVNEGIAAANPMLFAEGVPNVGSAQLSLMLGLKGGAQAIVGSRTAGLEALHLGAHRIASGACDRLIIGAAEERTDLLAAAYQHCVGPDLIIGPGAVTMVLESAQSAAKRSARPRGVIVATGSRRVPETDHSALRKAAKDLLNDVRTDQNSPPVSLAGMIAESFSVNGLAELAAALLDMSAACPESQNHCAWIVSTDPLGLAAAALVRCRIR
jgi:3-oxoacyl-[acyl-carrier-protein] synthase II